jgi:hypothetical protein
MRDYDFEFRPPSSTELVVGTAFLAAWSLAVALYWPDEKARADQKYASRSNAEHTQVCLNLGLELRSPGFGKCIAELMKLQVRHEGLLADHEAATSLY